MKYPIYSATLLLLLIQLNVFSSPVENTEISNTETHCKEALSSEYNEAYEALNLVSEDSCGFKNIIANVNKAGSWCDDPYSANRIQIDFEYEGLAEMFEVIRPDLSRDTIALENLPIRLFGFETNETLLEFSIRPIDDSGCVLPLFANDNYGRYLACNILCKYTAFLSCDESGNTNVEIELGVDPDLMENISTNVEISKDGILYYDGPLHKGSSGVFNYVTFPFSNTETDEITFDIFYTGYSCYMSVIELLPHSLCSEDENCELKDLEVNIKGCLSSETLELTVDFIPEKIGGFYFDVLDEFDNVFGTYPYGSLPLTIINFPITSENNTTIKIRDSSVECFLEKTFEVPDCENECIIGVFSHQIDQRRCNNCDDVDYTTDIEYFDATAFNVYILNYEYYSKIKLDSILPPFSYHMSDHGDGVAISITDVNDPCCRKFLRPDLSQCKYTVYESSRLPCSPFISNSINVSYETVIEEDSFYIDLQYMTFAFWLWNDALVWMNDEVIDTLLTDDDYFGKRLGPFVADGITDYKMTFTEICLNDGYCSHITDIGIVGEAKICALSNLSIDYLCDGEQSLIELNFDFVDPENEEYSVFIDNEFYQDYLLSELPQLIPVSRSDNNLLIQIKDREDCLIESIIEWNVCTGLEDVFPELNISQTASTLQIEYIEGLTKIELFDVTGKNIFSEDIIDFNANMSTISTADLPSGLYVLRLRADSKLYSQKIVVF